MVKVTWNNVYGNSGQGNFGTEQEAQAWLDGHLANNTFGLPERWLNEELADVETKEVLIHPKQVTCNLEDCPYYEGEEKTKECEDCEHCDSIIEAVKRTEYLHPAQYSYEIISESLDSLKTKKKLEFSLKSLSERKKDPLGQDYQVQNVVLGIYDNDKREAIASVHALYRNNYYRLADLIDACENNEELDAIEFEVIDG
jgi:hypothetical protein